MNDPEARAVYESELSRIQAVDRVVNGILDLLEERRAEIKMSKAELARRVGANPASVRRLLTAEGQNPQLSSLVEIALALGMESLPFPKAITGKKPTSQSSKARRGSSVPPPPE